MNYKKLIIESGLRMVREGLTISTWGNISARDPETGLIYLTPSALAYDKMTEDDIVVMDKDMNIVSGNRKPTIEYAMHISIMNARDDVNAIVHTHAEESLVFAIVRESIPVICDEGAQVIGGCVECAEYGMPGSIELANNVTAALADRNACLLANHGAVSVGKTMNDAFMVCTVLELQAKLYRKAMKVGTPFIYPKELTKANYDFKNNRYGK